MGEGGGGGWGLPEKRERKTVVREVISSTRRGNVESTKLDSQKGGLERLWVFEVTAAWEVSASRAQGSRRATAGWRVPASRGHKWTWWNWLRAVFLDCIGGFKTMHARVICQVEQLLYRLGGILWCKVGQVVLVGGSVSRLLRGLGTTRG
ncbi:hypothetical protein AMTR_s00055p00183400 [Amborella trichopoda]|uniref:Uncharacterized protein n=1 Tax=Amborella trichopoda TaxID=13333 RepID=U5DA57_AMBTC|nr:hypothetical protein AMTR_s00055p00183400 [Amborella trichopoda]